MVDDLAGRLVRAGLATRDLAGRVLGSAPPHEGALVSQLADLGVSEEGLAGFFVSEGFGPLMGRADLLDAERNAVARVPAEMAVELMALPIYLSPAGLVIAMAAPTDHHAVGELGRVSGQRVLPAAARVSDLRAALGQAYPGGRAAERTTERPPTRESEPPVLELVNRKRPGYRGSTKGAERVSARAAVGPTLVSEESGPFVPLVRTKPVTSSGPKQPRARTKTDPLPPAPFKKAITRNFERIQRDRSEGPVVSVGEGTARATWAKPDEPDKSAKWEASRALLPPKATLPPKEPPVAPPAPADGDGAARSFPRPTSPSDPPPAPKPGPRSSPDAPARDKATSVRPRSIIPEEHERWDLEAPENRIDSSKLGRMRELAASGRAPAEARRIPEVGGTLSAIRASRDRDEIVRLACEGALGVSRAAILLTLRKSVLKGWGGAGAGVSLDAIRNLWIPTSTPSVFRNVVRDKAPYVGPPGTSAADGLFRAALGSRGGDLALQPVVVGGRLVAVLAADDLSFGPKGAQRLEEIARAVADALERLIMASKRRG